MAIFILVCILLVSTLVETTLNNIDSILLNGAKLILDKVYDSVGFNRI